MEDAAMGTSELDSVVDHPLSCDQCPSVFTSLSELEEHLEIHKQERPYKCRQCEKSYRHAGSLVNHRKTHEVGLFTCLICQKDFSNPLGLKNHLRTHSEEKRFQCTDCRESFRTSKQLSSHRQIAHNDMNCGYAMANDEDFGDIQGSPDSSLPLLQENHNLLSNLENYIAESMVPADFSHLDMKDFPKPDLSRIAKDPPADDQPVQSEERRYKCKQCDKAYKHAGSLANHRQSHTVGVYQCVVCFKEFSNLMALKNHSRLHTEYKPYSCTLCDQCFRLPTELTSHQKLHTGDRPFLCAQCGQEFLTKREFQRHKRLHANLPVEAEAGQMRTPEGSENSTSEEEAIETSAKMDLYQHLPFQEDHKESLPEEHLSNHCHSITEFSDPNGSPSVVPQTDQLNDSTAKKDISPYINPPAKMVLSCANCGDAFSNNENLTNHACTYIEEESTPQLNDDSIPDSLKEEPQNNENPEERPYKCEECGKTYRHAGSLINHKNTHQTGVYNCSICTKQLFNMAALKNHLRAHLKNKANRGLDINLFNSSHFLPDSFQCTDGSYACTLCGESCASESDLELHHTLHEDIRMQATSAAFACHKRSPQGHAVEGEDSQELLQGNDQTYLNQQTALGLAVAEEIREIKRERGIPSMQWPSQVDTVVGVEDPDSGKDGDSPPTTGLALKKEDPCPNDSLPEQTSLGFQSPCFGEHHTHTSPDDDHSEYEQASQDLSTDNDRPYKCNLCDRTYRHRGSLVNHKHTHQTGIYQCSICPKQYSNVMALRNHVRFHFRTPLSKNKGGIGDAGGGLFSPGMEKFYSCTVCGEAFEDEIEWKAHQLMHNSQKELQDYQNASILQEEGETSIYGRFHMFATNEDLPHKDSSNYKQDSSERDAEYIENNELSEDGSREEDQMPHICGHCGHIYEDAESLQVHALVHEGSNTPIVKMAEETEQAAITKSELDQAVDGASQETFVQVDSLGEGCKSLTETRMYVCDLCAKSYRHSGSLINHKRTHQMGDYSCSVCSRQFNNLATLKNHIRSHQRSKRERGLETSDSSSLLSQEPSYSEGPFEGTSYDDDISQEAVFGSPSDQHLCAKLTDSKAVLTCQECPQSKTLQDLVEDIRTLHTADPNQVSECDSRNVNKEESENARGKISSDDTTSKQIMPEKKSEDKRDSDLVDGMCHFGGATCPGIQQGHSGEEGAQCTSPIGSPMETDPAVVCEGQAESSPDLDSTEERPFKCDECGKTYRHAGSLFNHKHTHQTGIYQCSFCPKEYPNLMALRNHFRNHTKPQFNRIRDTSGADFFGLPGEIHQPRSGEEVYDCSLCGLVFSDEGDFHQHQIAHSSYEAPPGLEINTRLQKCLEGGQYDSSADDRFAEMHLSDFSFQMHAAEKELLRRLKHEMKDMDQGDAQDGAYFSESHLSHICGFCGKTYDDLESLKAHSLSHSDENTTSNEKAPTCPRVAFEKLNFDASQLSDAEGSVSKSEMVAKTNFLIDDPKITEGPERRPYACNQCGKTYRHGGSLVNHKKTHQVGDYQCSGCSRQYPNLAAYRNHLRHHPKCKELVNTNDELKATSTPSESHCLGADGEMLGNSSVNEDTWKKPDAHQLHMLYSNAMSQEDHVHPTKMATNIPNNKDSSLEVTETSHYEKIGDGSLLGDSAVAHTLHLGVPSISPDAPTVKVDKSVGSDTPNTVDIKPKICDFCGQICDGVDGLENHKTLICAGHPKESIHVASSSSSFGDTNILPVSVNIDNADRLNGSQELGDGNFQQRPFRCEVCGRSYRHPGSLINHRQTHKTGLFRCSVCQKRFYNMMALKNHNRIHFEMKRYKCPDCGKAFRLQKQLLAHQKMHRDKPALSTRPNRQGKRVVKIPLRLLDELRLVDQVPSGASPVTKHCSGAGEKKVRLKRRHLKKTLNPDERPYRCEQCGRSYRHAGSLLNHKRSHTTGHYCCPICDKSYPNLLAMKTHQRVHFEVKRHVCTECGKAFKWQRQLSRHQLIHTLKKHVCNICGQTIRGKLLFEKHQMEHHNGQAEDLPDSAGELLQEHPVDVNAIEKPLNIQTTNKKTGVARRRFRTYKSETGGVHKNHVLQDCVPLCQSCRFVFSTFEELEAHHCENPDNATSMSESLHPLTTQFDPVGTALSLNQKTDDVTLKQENTILGQVEERPYKCTVCGRTYRHAGSLQNHKNTHTTGLYKCSVCSKQFFNPMAIKNHLRNHTATKRFQCQECGKAFRATRELVTHQRVHTGERPFSCLFCHRGFSSKLSLKQHQHVHNSIKTEDQVKKETVSSHSDAPANGLVDEGAKLAAPSADDQARGDGTTVEDRRYKCTQCDRAYRHAGSLQNHKKTHTTGVYHCPTCHKQFFNLLAMKNHLRIHLDQNRYKCLDCGKAFRVSSRLASHRRIHTQSGPYSCPFCLKKFFRKSTFQRHQLLHKDEQRIPPQDGVAPGVLVEVT